MHIKSSVHKRISALFSAVTQETLYPGLPGFHNKTHLIATQN